MLEKLESPPLVEAICEFRFSSKEEWDWTIPGRLYNLLKEDGFTERDQVKAISVKLGAKSDLPTVEHVPAGIDRVHMKQKDGSAMVQVGPHLLAITHLTPYSSWDEYLIMILNVLDKYFELATIPPFKRIGLRYINQIPLGEKSFEIGRYITFDPPIPKTTKQPLKHFFQRYEFIHEEPKGTLIHQTGLVSKAEDQTFIMLDLDFASFEVSHLDSKKVGEWLTEAHTRIEDEFKTSIQPAVLKEMKG